MLDKVHKHIDITVLNEKEYFFTCIVCNGTDNKLLLTAKGAINVSNNFKKKHQKCGKKLTQTVST